MTAWLDPLRTALAEAPSPVTFFFRDDDAGWDDERLRALLDVFLDRGAPLDLAVIPAELRPPLARELLARARTAPVGFHQHGFAHVNHEAEGRPAEFGPSRTAEDLRRDLAYGRERLGALLGDALDPIFTPPWNRCSKATAECLAELDFAVVSRDSGAAPFGIPGLDELPISVDWLKRRKGVRLSLEAVGELLAAAARDRHQVGVMLHHEAMDGADLHGVADLLALLRGHTSVELRQMRDLSPAEIVAGVADASA